MRGPQESQLILKFNPGQKRGHYSLLFTELLKVLSICSFVMPRPFCPVLQTVCSALWGLCGGHLSHRAGDARGGRCVPHALLHLQRMFLPPADRRPLCLQGGTVTVCQRGLPSVSGQPHFLVHRYKLFTACLFMHVCASCFCESQP